MTADSTDRREGRVHDLKVWPPFYDHLAHGDKPFEVRRNDRGFAVGDKLWLREWNPDTGDYTGQETTRTVTYILRDGECPGQGLAAGFVVLGLAHLDATGPARDEGLREALEAAERECDTALIEQAGLGGEVVAVYAVLPHIRTAIAALAASPAPARDEELRALSDAATPGPWAIDTSPGFEYHIRTSGTTNAVSTEGEPVADAAVDADAAFIVACVNYVRAALAASPAPGGDTAPREDGGPRWPMGHLWRSHRPGACTCDPDEGVTDPYCQIERERLARALRASRGMA